MKSTNHKQEILPEFLRYLALGTMVIGFFPVIFLLHQKILKNKAMDQMIIDVFLVILAGVLGFLCDFIYGRVAQKYQQRLGIKIICGVVSYLVTLGSLIGIIYLVHKSDIVSLVCSLIVAVPIYFIIIKEADKPYYAILVLNSYMILVAVSVLCMVFSSSPYHVGVFFILTASYAFIQNQSIVERMLERTSKNTTMLSKIRRYNAFLVCGIFIFFVLSYMLRGFVIDFFRFFLKCVGKLIDFMIWVLYMLLGTKKGEGIADDGMFVPSQIESQGNMLGYIEFIVLTLIALRILFIVIKYRKKIYLFIIKLVKNLKASIADFFRLKVKVDEENRAYYDYVEILMPEKRKAIKLRKEKPEKNWRKQYKDFLKRESGNEKYRLGYKLLLEGFRIKKVNILTSDTPIQICKKIMEREEINSMKQVTEVYNEVRYGEGKANETSMEQMTQLLTSLNNGINNN